MTKATLNQAQEILKLVTQSGIEKNSLQTLLESGKFTAFLYKSMISRVAYKVIIDYDMSFKEMIEAGKYGRVNDEITVERFPINKRESGEVELHLIHFGRIMTIKEILAELDEQGLRPAELPELCALGATHPELGFPIVALGSWLRRPDHVSRHPTLYDNDLSVCRTFKSRLGDEFRFLAVSK